MSEITITADVLPSEKSSRFHENTAPIVKPNSLPLNEINLPSFRDISPFSTSPNDPIVNDCATTSSLYQDLNDKYGNMNVNDFHSDVHLQRLQQKQMLVRQNHDATDFSSPMMKTKLSSQEDVRHFVDQNRSPFKAVQTTSNPISHLQSPFYDHHQQQTIRSLLTDGQQFQTTYSPMPPYSSYTSHDTLHDLNTLSSYFTNRVRLGENSLSHISPSIEELKPFPNHPDGTPAEGDIAGNFGPSFITPSGDIPPLKVADFNEASVGNYNSNSHLNEALIKLRQQNSMSSKLLPQNLIDPNQYGSMKKDFLLRQSMPNLTPMDAERITKHYLNELIRENPSLLATHLLSSMPISALHLPFNMPNNHVESYSRKVFVGGLPPDSDEDEITASFRQFGPLIVDWPHKAETKTNFPPKGYCFLLFQDEMSVQNLIDACIQDDGKHYWCITCTAQKDKPVRRVQIRPWCLVDSDFVMDGSQPLDLRKTIFVGGVPRPLRAVELALAMERLYGGVCYAGIDTDPELKYPKGAGRVSFSNQQSYIAAISARFVQLQLGDIDKRVEVKPYVLDDQLCDECQGQKCAGKSAPYFCANVACLQYYCEVCWVQIHSRPGREYHKPLVKEGADRPKSIPPFKW